MIDNYFRNWLPKYLSFVIRLFATLGLTPNQITVFGLIISLCSAYLLYLGYLLSALCVWWLSRLFDALDGIYARKYHKTSNFGAFLDIQADMFAYSAMVIAFYLQFPQYALQWLLIILCYVLCIAGALGLGSFENKAGIKDASGRGLRLAVGLAEGGETGIFYSLFLLMPQFLAVTTWIWIGVLALTIASRLLLAWRELKVMQ